jgi:hypothetical protein
LLISAGLLAACQRDLPTAADPAPPAVWLTTDQAGIARITISDALDRIVPGLSNAAAAAPLASSLTALLATLDGGSVDGTALAGALNQVWRYERATDTDGAELEVIRLALVVVQN